MKNDFTMEEIKNSVEYQWRKNQVKLYLTLWLIIVGATIFIPIIVSASNYELIVFGIISWLCAIVIFGLLFGSFALFSYSKMRYLLKNYQKFNSYEVVLDKVSTSYAYRGAIYYTVTINDKDLSKKVDTNPYFSSSLMSKFSCEDYNNKKVVGLYDDNMDKFYIVKRVD
ncbi:MAG: hypothetical protein J1F31_06495 [Erysipelotrichales bacterium]|nr:hypothetical protein [Erysipelotrichales bacterium]